MDAPAHNLSDRLYDRLRRQIVLHEIAPGQPIRQDVLAKDLGVSKIPLREALYRLNADGLVKALANRGFIAAPLSAVEADDIFSLRMLIEPPTAAITAVCAPRTQRDRVASVYRSLAKLNQDARESMTARRSIMLALLAEDEHPTRLNIAATLFDRAERYNQGKAANRPFDMASLLLVVSTWLDGDGEGVRSVYRDRLATREKIALSTWEYDHGV